MCSDTSPSSVLFGGWCHTLVMSHFGDVPKKVRVFSLKKLFLKRFTVRSTTRTLITDKNDHSAFTAIRVKQFLPDAKIWRLGRPGKLRGNETENVFLSWLGWLYSSI